MTFKSLRWNRCPDSVLSFLFVAYLLLARAVVPEGYSGPFSDWLGLQRVSIQEYGAMLVQLEAFAKHEVITEAFRKQGAVNGSFSHQLPPGAVHALLAVTLLARLVELEREGALPAYAELSSGLPPEYIVPATIGAGVVALLLQAKTQELNLAQL
mmetsp:Transcript_56293/g.138145  ORF Transcript_56293/g.138145 Transcript_56293/m.138145 type:complete len:155 (+) Transcript_56293:679-1143(+)